MNDDPLALAKRQYAFYTGKVVEESPWKEATLTGPLVTSQEPARAGESWTDKERVALTKGFLRKKTVEDLADAHQRSVGGIRSELDRLGFVQGDRWWEKR